MRLEQLQARVDAATDTTDPEYFSNKQFYDDLLVNLIAANIES